MLIKTFFLTDSGNDLLNIVRFLKNNFSVEEGNDLLKKYISESYDSSKYYYPSHST